jgi:hypothetical protein
MNADAKLSTQKHSRCLTNQRIAVDNSFNFIKIITDAIFLHAFFTQVTSQNKKVTCLLLSTSITLFSSMFWVAFKPRALWGFSHVSLFFPKLITGGTLPAKYPKKTKENLLFKYNFLP